jgi:hypothetical protein
MDKFKALSLVLLGMVIGLGYAVACGSDDDKGAAGPMLPGVGVAMAQGSCAQWDALELYNAEVPPGTPDGTRSAFRLPAGWVPLGGADGLVWIARCAQ